MTEEFTGKFGKKSKVALSFVSRINKYYYLHQNKVLLKKILSDKFTINHFLQRQVNAYHSYKLFLYIFNQFFFCSIIVNPPVQEPCLFVLKLEQKCRYLRYFY